MSSFCWHLKLSLSQRAFWIFMTGICFISSSVKPLTPLQPDAFCSKSLVVQLYFLWTQKCLIPLLTSCSESCFHVYLLKPGTNILVELGEILLVNNLNVCFEDHEWNKIMVEWIFWSSFVCFLSYFSQPHLWLILLLWFSQSSSPRHTSLLRLQFHLDSKKLVKVLLS